MKDRLTIVVRVLFATVVGIFAAGLIFPVVHVLLQFLLHGNNLVSKYMAPHDMFEAALGFTILGVIVASPLILITVIVAIVFKDHIEKRPAIWCASAPFAIWSFVCLVEPFFRNTHHYGSAPLSEVLAGTFLRTDNLIYLLTPMVPAVIFYMKTREALFKDNEPPKGSSS